MFNEVNNLIRLKGNLYITDFLDIFIIGLMIYSLFIFLRKTRTYLVFFGIAIAAGLYLVAKSFNLYVTLLTLKYFVGISVLMFAIIFQNEIRKYFEFLGLVGTRQIKVGPLASRSPTTTEIIQACVRMAQLKIGALIVIQGRDNLDQFIEGGVSLDGVISEELLLSIFDPHSDGHDGALIISNNRISKFATHLPLSNNFKEIGKHGTRHSAALGLSETTDALCVVVSEEKGQISVAKDGKLKTLGAFSDLEKELDKFIKAKFTTNGHVNSIGKFVKQHLLLKVGALITAGIIWFFAAYQTGIVEKTYSLPLDTTKLPKNVTIESYSPKEIKVKVSSRGEEAFSNISSKDFRISLDYTNLQDGVNKLEVGKSNIVAPVNFSIVSHDPAVVLLTVNKFYQAELPVIVTYYGNVDEKFNLKSVESTPSVINVWLPEGSIPPIEIRSENIDLTGKTESFITPLKLLLPEGTKLVDDKDIVNAAVTIEPKEDS